MDESTLPPSAVSSMMTSTAAVRLDAVHERERLWREFLARAAQGDTDAFGAFYDATSSLVYSLAMRILGNRADAEEVTLDTYVQAWREAGRFDAARGTVASWLITIARSRALDRYRSQQARQKRQAAAVEDDRPSLAPSPEDLSAMSQDRRLVAQALASLPPDQFQVIELAYFQGLSQSEMAERLDLPLGTVKSRVRSGLIRLRQLIGEQNG